MINLLTLLNAADKAGVSESNFETLDTSLAFMRSPSLVSGVATTMTGPPAAGTFPECELWCDALSALWFCITAGTPGTWTQVAPGIATAFPGTAPPAGYQLWRADQGKPWTYNGSSWITSAAGALCGTFAIPNAAGGVTVTGLGLPYTPTVVIAIVAQPVGALQIGPVNIVNGTLSTDGFQVTWNGLTDSSSYVLHFIVA